MIFKYRTKVFKKSTGCLIDIPELKEVEVENELEALRLIRNWNGKQQIQTKSQDSDLVWFYNLEI